MKFYNLIFIIKKYFSYYLSL